MQFGEFGPDGRRKSIPKPGLEFAVPADTVIPAVSQYASFPFVPDDKIARNPGGTFMVDPETMMTTLPGVFAGGDLVRGPDTVIRAVADGKKAAASIDRYLGGMGVLNKGEKISIVPDYDTDGDDEVVELRRYPLDMLNPHTRKESFDEVVLGYHKLTAMAEAMRCLHCDRR
jgi:NADH-quinone oxidoreductase subunit F